MTYPPVLPIHSTAAVSSPRTVHFAEVVSGKQEGAVSNHNSLKVCHGAVQQTVLRSIPKTCYLYFFFFFFFIPFNAHGPRLWTTKTYLVNVQTVFQIFVLIVVLLGLSSFTR
uniref:Uncharacterized protein n=1 Tax=Cacopsylla melanoneura TaxID=428564 RepID=A0A8D8TGN2_9HEMI